jgi:hypothetical protein
LTKQSRDYCAAIDDSHRFRGRFAGYAAAVAPKPSPNDRTVEVSRRADNCCKPKTSKSPAAMAGLLFSKTATRIPQKYDQNTRKLFSGQRSG